MSTTSKNIFGALLAAVGFFVLLGLVWFEYGKMQDLKVAIDEREKLVVERTELAASIKKLTDQYRSAIGDTRKFEAVIPRRQDIDEVVSALEVISQRSGIQIDDTSIIEDKAGMTQTLTRTMAINIKGKGPYEGIRTFVSNLEQNVRLIDLQSFELTTEEGSTLITFDVKARAYFIP